MRIYRNCVDKAIAIIRGYCNKNASCDTCRYGIGKGNCPFTDGTLPCDWDADEMTYAHKKKEEM